VLAAQRAGVREVIFPQGNKIDIDSLDADVREGVDLIAAPDIDSILSRVLTSSS
jgi:ATP-dependent Lon protease